MATIKDVAKHAGVSIATVSRVINNRAPISEATRKNVYEAMARLNYQPNEMARALQKKESHIIGLIVPNISFPFFAKIANAAAEACHENGYKLMLCKSGKNGSEEKEMMAMLQANKVDGILVCSRLGSVSIYRKNHLPIISIDREIPGIPSLTCDNLAGGRLAAHTLYQAGCRTPLLLTSAIPDYMSAGLRLKGFCGFFEEKQITPLTYTLSDDFSSSEYDFDTAEFVAFLDLHKEIDGIFASSDWLAVNFMHWLKSSHFCYLKNIPWIGFDGLDSSFLFDLSTIAQPINDMGEMAVELLIRKINKKAIPDLSILPVQLIERASTALYSTR